jgi:hypothetical protein
MDDEGAAAITLPSSSTCRALAEQGTYHASRQHPFDIAGNPQRPPGRQAFYFVGQANYADAANPDLSRALNPTEVTHYILATCGTIDEALAATSVLCSNRQAKVGMGGGAPIATDG